MVHKFVWAANATSVGTRAGATEVVTVVTQMAPTK